MSGQTPTTEQQEHPEQPTTDELMRKQEERHDRATAARPWLHSSPATR
nr:hypothetical protein OH820_11670 [Streptomyces sp. NBC_00857]